MENQNKSKPIDIDIPEDKRPNYANKMTSSDPISPYFVPGNPKTKKNVCPLNVKPKEEEDAETKRKIKRIPL